MKKFFALLLSLIFLLTACLTRENNMRRIDSFFLEDSQIAEIRLRQVLDAIQKQDREKLKSAFSENAIRNAENIDESAECLFDYFQGTLISYEGHNGGDAPCCEKEVSKGKKR